MVNVTEVVASLDEQIEKLSNARSVLAELQGDGRRMRKRGGKRVMSAAARKRIAAAQKARWAAYKAKKS